MMVKNGVSIVCLQEVICYKQENNIITTLLQKLGEDWKAICHLGKEQNVLGMGNCILWNTRVLNITKKQDVLLPYSKKLSLHEKAFSWLAGGTVIPFRRRAIIGYFMYKNQRLRVTNVHLDHNGGKKNRCRQLNYLINILQQESNNTSDIICGDFNNFDLLGNNNELKEYIHILHDYEDTTTKIDWSADLYLIDTTAGNKFLQILIKNLHIHLRKKLDFIWVKNVTFSGSEKMLLPGSDHLPVVTSLLI